MANWQEITVRWAWNDISMIAVFGQTDNNEMKHDK